MNFLSLNKLSNIHINNIKNLVQICRSQEPITLSFPTDHDDNFAPAHNSFFLAYEAGQLAGAVSLVVHNSEICECIGFTHPDFRRKGIFQKLLSLAADEMEEYPDLEFYLLSDGKSQDTQAALDALECVYLYSELLMEYALAAKTLPEAAAAPDSDFLISWETADSDGSQFLIFHCCLNGIAAGSCNVAVYPSFAYLFGLEITKEYRGLGYGRTFLYKVLETLKSQGIAALKLQVSSQNTAAFRLYQSCGFQISEEIRYSLW